MPAYPFAPRLKRRYSRAPIPIAPKRQTRGRGDTRSTALRGPALQLQLQCYSPLPPTYLVFCWITEQSIPMRLTQIPSLQPATARGQRDALSRRENNSAPKKEGEQASRSASGPARPASSAACRRNRILIPDSLTPVHRIRFTYIPQFIGFMDSASLYVDLHSELAESSHSLPCLI